MVPCLGEPPRKFLLLLIFTWFLYLHFHCWSSFCCCSSFTFASRHHPSPFRGLSPICYTHFIFSAQPIAEWLATPSFSTIPLFFYCERYGFEWEFFYPQPFFTLCSLTNILTYIYQGLPGSWQFFLDVWQGFILTLFVWFTVIHNLHNQNDSFLNSAIY